MNRASLFAEMSDRECLEMAVRNLTQLAQDLRASHTLSGGDWGIDPIDIGAKREHDIAVALSARLRRIAKRYSR